MTGAEEQLGVEECGYPSHSDRPTIFPRPARLGRRYSRSQFCRWARSQLLFDPFSRRAGFFFLLYFGGPDWIVSDKITTAKKNDDEKKAERRADEAKTNTEKWQRKPADSRGLPSSAAAPTAPVTALSSSVCCTAVGRPSSPLIAAGACSLCLC